MSLRSLGMVGKTYKTASEAFRDADYATAIQRPQQSEHGLFWALLWAFFVVGGFGYSFWLTINRYA